jgi:hypothetical protein
MLEIAKRGLGVIGVREGAPLPEFAQQFPEPQLGGPALKRIRTEMATMPVMRLAEPLPPHKWWHAHPDALLVECRRKLQKRCDATSVLIPIGRGLRLPLIEYIRIAQALDAPVLALPVVWALIEACMLAGWVQWVTSDTWMNWGPRGGTVSPAVREAFVWLRSHASEAVRSAMPSALPAVALNVACHQAGIPRYHCDSLVPLADLQAWAYVPLADMSIPDLLARSEFWRRIYDISRTLLKVTVMDADEEGGGGGGGGVGVGVPPTLARLLRSRWAVLALWGNDEARNPTGAVDALRTLSIARLRRLMLGAIARQRDPDRASRLGPVVEGLRTVREVFDHMIFTSIVTSKQFREALEEHIDHRTRAYRWGCEGVAERHIPFSFFSVFRADFYVAFNGRNPLLSDRVWLFGRLYPPTPAHAREVVPGAKRKHVAVK